MVLGVSYAPPGREEGPARALGGRFCNGTRPVSRSGRVERTAEHNRPPQPGGSAGDRLYPGPGSPLAFPGHPGSAEPTHSVQTGHIGDIQTGDMGNSLVVHDAVTLEVTDAVERDDPDG